MGTTYHFQMPAGHKSIIKVIGIGGGGSNAVTHMYNEGITGVEFVVCNTDAQALKSSAVKNKLQIGIHLTEGLGAGANPERGRDAAVESKEDIRELLSESTKMVFITAGMGGGTGTGAAPVIAEIAKELDILTVGIVTAPFIFEGKKKMLQAESGIRELKKYCDTVIVIPNDRLREIYGNLSIRQAFAKADNVLTTAAKSIAEIITVTSDVNVDFEDVKTVMKDSGAAVMGSAITSGENRARRAAEEALLSPLLNNTDIFGARKILLSILFGEEAELTMDELTEITDFIEEKAGDNAEVIFGQGLDPTLGDAICVTVIATGFDDGNEEYMKSVIYDLERSPNQTNLFVDILPETTEPEEPTIKNPETHFEETPPAEEEPTAATENEITLKSASFDPEPERPQPTRETELNINRKKEELSRRSQDRINKLRNLDGNYTLDPNVFKEKLDLPAYQRKNINLTNSPDSSEEEVSRYRLTEDNEILGENKFLHDNVD